MFILSPAHLISLPTVLELLILFFLSYVSRFLPIIIILLIVIKSSLSKGTPSSKVSATSMKAIIYTPFSTMCLTNRPIPSLLPNQVLISVKASSINPVDYKINPTKFPFIRWLSSFTVARDVAGTVIDIGQNVTKFKIGDIVYGCSSSGSLAEFSTADENKIAKVPSNMNILDMVGIALAGDTAYQSLLWFIKKEDLPSKTVLVIGGSGGVGSQALQILKYYNTKAVYGVCSSKNESYVKELCDKVIDYTKGIEEQIGDVKFDLIFDTVTSMEDENQRIKYAKFLNEQNGKYVQINGKPIEFMKGIFTSHVVNVPGVEDKNYHLHLLNWKGEDLEELAKMASEGKLKVRKEVVKFTEDEVVNAFNKLKSRRTVGKIVIDMESK